MSMQKRLSILLLVQVVIAAVIFWQTSQDNYDFEDQPLLPFSTAEIEKLVISDDEETSATLEKINGIWVLPEKQGVAINADKISELVEKFKTLELTWPVATTTGSHERFEVAENKFQRKLVFMKGEQQLGILYLGSSPGFRKVHIRRDGEDAVFAVELNTYDIPAVAKDWLDLGMLALESVNKISAGDFALSKTGDLWSFAPPSDVSLAVEQSKASSMASAIGSLRVLGVADEFPTNIVYTLDVSSDAGSYKFSLATNEGTYYIKRDDLHVGFTISESTFSALSGSTLQNLVVKPEETEDEKDSSEDTTADESGTDKEGVTE